MEVLKRNMRPLQPMGKTNPRRNRQPADVETIKHVFSKDNVVEELKHWIVDEAIDGGLDSFVRAKAVHYPWGFISMALERTIQRLSILLSMKEITESTKRTSVNDRVGTQTSERWREECRMKGIRDRIMQIETTKRSEEARFVARTNGVECIDWVEVRAKDIARENEEWKKRREKVYGGNGGPSTGTTQEESVFGDTEEEEWLKSQKGKSDTRSAVIEHTASDPKIHSSTSNRDTEPAVFNLQTSAPAIQAALSGLNNGGIAKEYSPSVESAWSMTRDEVEKILEKAFKNHIPGSCPPLTAPKRT